MGETVPAVAGDDVDVVLALVLADEGDFVDGFEDLAGPFVVYCTCFGESVPDPFLETCEAPVLLLLTDLVIAAADDEVVVFLVAGGEADVVVGICLVVDKAIFDTAFGHSNSNAVCSMELHFCDNTQFLERYASSFYCILASDGVSLFGTDTDFFTQETFFFDGHDPGTSVAREVRLLFQPLQNADEVLGRMESRLVLETATSLWSMGPSHPLIA